MEKFTFIATCQNGKKVFERPFTHWHINVAIDTLIEALSKLTPTGAFCKEVLDMGRIIGKSNCVEVTKDDNIVYVIRKDRKGPTPMAKNRTPVDCSLLTIILKQIETGDYLLISSYIGEGEPEPWDSNFYDHFTWEKKSNLDEDLYQRCIHFWNTHALVYDETDIALQLSI